MKTKLIVKTSIAKLEAVREELREKHRFAGEMEQWRYVVDNTCYIFVFFPIRVPWLSLHGYHVDEVDMDDVLDGIRELELHATEIELFLARRMKK